MATTSREPSFIPLWQQVVNDLKADIGTGVYELLDRIPSEADLCERFGVSRITVRRAVDELVNEGYLVRKRGCGTFVSRPNVLKVMQRDNVDHTVMSYSGICSQSGYKPGARPVSCRKTKPPVTCQRLFGVSPSADVLRVERVRTADDLPVLIETNFFSGPAFDFLLDLDLADCSLFGLIEERLGLVPELHESCTLEVYSASTEMAAAPEVVPGEPLFCLAGDYYDQYGNPLFYGEQYIVGSRYFFAV